MGRRGSKIRSFTPEQPQLNRHHRHVTTTTTTTAAAPTLLVRGELLYGCGLAQIIVAVLSKILNRARFSEICE